MLKAPHRPSRAALEVKLTQSGAELRSEYCLTRLYAMDRGILRLRCTRRERFEDDFSPFIINRSEKQAQKVLKEDDCVWVVTEGICARLSLETGELETYDLDGKKLFTEGGLRTLEEYSARRIDPGSKAETAEIETADGKKLVVKDAARTEYRKLYSVYLPMRF